MKNKSGNFHKLENIVLVSTFFALWLAVMFEDTFENYIAYLFILSFGFLFFTKFGIIGIYSF